MKLVIAGSRTVSKRPTEIDEIVTKHGIDVNQVSCVISGTAREADVSGEQWAVSHQIPVVRYPANWDAQGKIAGHIRNAQMAVIGDALLVLWDGKSRGTKNMIEEMRLRNKPVFIEGC